MTFDVKEAFNGKSILITGGTGFLGKVIIEKLLWTIDSIDKIYLLIRPLKGKKANERLKILFNDPLFNRIRVKKPDVFSKIIPISGDIMQDNLGLSAQDIQEICENTNIVIHSAATVKFDEHLRTAVNMNLSGTTRMISLCYKIKNLTSFVHISTAYANCDRYETEEKIYKQSIPPDMLMDALKWMDDECLEMITSKLLGARPNTYTLTKALAESQLEKEAQNLPVIIIRPSIVGAMCGQPLPGWTDNINGPTGIFAAVGKGVLTNMCGNKTSKADIIPVDIVANTIIVSAAYRASRKFNSIPIIHCTSGELNPLYWDTIVIFLEQFYKKYPMVECYGVPSTQFHQNRSLFLFNYYAKHQLPAYIIDKIYSLIGRKANNVRLYQKIWKMIEALHFFTTRGWRFISRELPALCDQMSDEDKKVYNCDIKSLNWESYLFDYVMGIKRFILHEKLTSIENARRNLTRLRQKRFLTIGMCYYILLKLFSPRWRQTKKIAAWISAMIVSYVITDVNFRRRIHLKSLKEYTNSFDSEIYS